LELACLYWIFFYNRFSFSLTLAQMTKSAFHWNTGEPSIMAKTSKQSEAGKRGIAILIEQKKKEGNKMYATPNNEFTTYSKAKAIRFN
jgi:DsbC/DsbD-like thiol-disulfide interchange protein